MPDRDDFLRELHHRVKNNFQIIASLMNLQKRMLPPERRNDLRFVEEHVQSMAVAYRIVSTSNEMVQVSLEELIVEVVDNLRQIAGAKPSDVTYELSQAGSEIELNQSVVLGLYLAAVLPPRLDRTAAGGKPVRVRSSVLDGMLTITVGNDEAIDMDFMRRRLVDSYIRQLRGKAPAAHHGEVSLQFALDPPRVAISPGGSLPSGGAGTMPGGTVTSAPR